MSKNIDRIGEKNINNFGSEMIIIGYRNAFDIDVYFPEYNWIFKKTYYSVFKDGKTKCPYEPRVYGKGCIGEGKYKSRINGKKTEAYNIWCGMIQRCYSEKNHKKQPTYIGCSVCEEWLNFQNFAKWYEDNFYQIEGERMHLDKDILYKHNKIYSPKTCIFVPQRINTLFIKSDKIRGDYPIGVSYDKEQNKYSSTCKVYDFKLKKQKSKKIGRYNTPEEAFTSYKNFKERHIKEVADYYKNEIPSSLYNAMYNYNIEITD